MESRQAIDASPWRASGRTLPRLSRRAGFWAVAFSFLAVTAFSTAPSSLYGLYEHQEHLSSLTITIVYAVYAVGIVVSLLLAGHVSDWYGRRPVLLPALAVAIVAAAVFLVWRSLAGLLMLFLIAGLVAGAGIGAIIRGSLTVVISTSGADDRAGALATFFTAGYAGVSLPVVAIGIVLQHLSPRVTLLIFSLVVGLGFLAAAPILIRPARAAEPSDQGDDTMMELCRCFGTSVGHERRMFRRERRN